MWPKFIFNNISQILDRGAGPLSPPLDPPLVTVAIVNTGLLWNIFFHYAFVLRKINFSNLGAS